MSFATFTFNSGTNAGADIQDSAAVVIAAGESIRVRFTEFTPTAEAFLVVTANGVTSTIPIDNKTAWVSGAVAASDSVIVRARLNSSSGRVAGIVAGFS